MYYTVQVLLTSVSSVEERAACACVRARVRACVRGSELPCECDVRALVRACVRCVCGACERCVRWNGACYGVRAVRAVRCAACERACVLLLGGALRLHAHSHGEPAIASMMKPGQCWTHF